MDAEAEVKIFERFRELTDDKIAIVISHRFSTVRMADQIIVLDHGTIIERGSHDELRRPGRPLRDAVQPAGAGLPLTVGCTYSARRYTLAGDASDLR